MNKTRSAGRLGPFGGQSNSLREYGKAFLLSFGIAFLFIVPFILRGHGILYVVDDFNLEQIPFNVISNASVKSGNVFWNWYNDLGSQFIGSYSFYTLGSPFFWLSCLFPSQAFPYLIGPLLMLKFAAAGATSYAYLRRFMRHSGAAMVGSLLYAFSSFQLSSITFNHFADVVAFFPLLLIALEEAVVNRRRGAFVLTVALCALINYFFFAGEVVFLAIYFFVRFLAGGYFSTLRQLLRSVGHLLWEGVLGIGIASVLFIPSMMFTLANPRTSSGFATIKSMLVYDRASYMSILIGAMMPAQVLHQWSMGIGWAFSSTQCFLPLFGFLLVLAFVLRNRKSWITWLLAVCLVFYLIPVLNSVFYGFNATFYGRWLYMPTLIMALASARVLDEDEPPSLRLPMAALLGLYLVFMAFLYVFSAHWNWQIIYNEHFVIYQLLLIGFGLLSAIYLFSRRKEPWFYRRAALLTGVFIVLSGSFVINHNEKLYPSPTEFTQLYTNASNEVTIPAGQNFRVDTLACYRNISMLLNIPNDGSFNSTVNDSLFRFYDSLGDTRVVETQLPFSQYGLRPFLSTRYVLVVNGYPNLSMLRNFGSVDNLPDLTPIEKTAHFTLYESSDFIPMGYTFDSYMTESQFESIPQEQRHLALLKALILTPAQEQEYGSLLPDIDGSTLSSLSQSAYNADVANRKAEASTSFTRSNTGFTAQITLKKDNLAFFSVPYDRGWSAKVDGKAVPVEQVDYGLMAVPCGKGTHTITFTYLPASYLIGFSVTLISILLFVLYMFARRWLPLILPKRSLPDVPKDGNA